MKILRNILLAFTLSISTILFNNITAHASVDLVNVESEESAIGGWNEEQGYFSNPQMYSNNIRNLSIPYSEPRHTGKAEEKVINGTGHKRAHGWTTWVGVYHYTRARMELNLFGETTILTDSGRVWGKDGTEAISPWWAFDGEIIGSARTYYGN